MLLQSTLVELAILSSTKLSSPVMVVVGISVAISMELLAVFLSNPDVGGIAPIAAIELKNTLLSILLSSSVCKLLILDISKPFTSVTTPGSIFFINPVSWGGARSTKAPIAKIPLGILSTSVSKSILRPARSL